MPIGTGEPKNGLYLYRDMYDVTVHQIGVDKQLDLWHKRLGHPSLKVIQMIPSLRNSHRSENLNKVCEVCERSKQTRDKFSLSDCRALNIFDLIHCDLWGPYITLSSCGASYFLTLVDDYSRAVSIYLLCEKKEVAQIMMDFFSLVERQYNRQVKMVRSDNDTEFMCLKQYFQKHGIIHQTSYTGTPQQNGRVERKHRHILNVARALRFQGKLPLKFWGECILAAGYYTI